MNRVPQGWELSATLPDAVGLRDYFAAAALQGLCAALASDTYSGSLLARAEQLGTPFGVELAKDAWAMADAMFKAREGEPPCE